ncbi:uncharacterized protein E1O_01480 [Burkholderiales bacterium GJ-E10]|nr:uncharacterized protein E1O_01480 [Burkholderiales bacterium GJ-E10]
MDNTKSGTDGVLDLGDGMGGRRVIEVPLERLRPDPEQPRRHFDDETIEELAQSMAMVGQLQAIGVRKTADFWDIVYGERRWRAARLLGWKSIQAREFASLGPAKLVLQAIENMHREELSLDEYATIVLRLVEAGMPLAAAARALGRKEAWAATMLQIARDPVARGLIDAGRLQSADAWEQFCALDADARRLVLDSTDPVTGPRCRQVLEQCRRETAARQQTMPLAPVRSEPGAGARETQARADADKPETIVVSKAEWPYPGEPWDRNSPEEPCEGAERAARAQRAGKPDVFEVDLPLDLCLRLLPGMREGFEEHFRLPIQDLRRHAQNRAALDAALVARIRELAGEANVC